MSQSFISSNESEMNRLQTDMEGLSLRLEHERYTSKFLDSQKSQLVTAINQNKQQEKNYTEQDQKRLKQIISNYKRRVKTEAALLNNEISQNQALKVQIDKMREKKIFYKIEVEKLMSELGELGSKYSEIQSNKQVVEKQGNQYKTISDRLIQQSVYENKTFSDRISVIEQISKQDLKVAKKSLQTFEHIVDTRENYADDLIICERIMRTLINSYKKVNFIQKLEKKAKKCLHYVNMVFEMSGVLEEVRRATGIVNDSEIVHTIVKFEEQQNALLKYYNELTNDIEQLEQTKEALYISRLPPDIDPLEHSIISETIQDLREKFKQLKTTVLRKQGLINMLGNKIKLTMQPINRINDLLNIKQEHQKLRFSNYEQIISQIESGMIKYNCLTAKRLMMIQQQTPTRTRSHDSHQKRYYVNLGIDQIDIIRDPELEQSVPLRLPELKKRAKEFFSINAGSIMESLVAPTNSYNRMVQNSRFRLRQRREHRTLPISQLSRSVTPTL